MNPTIDPRIEPLFRSRPPHERFLAAALCAILSHIPSDDSPRGETMLDVLAKHVKGQEVDWTEKVAGKPLLHWSGKTRELIEREAGPQGLAAVLKAYEARGITPPPGPKPAATVRREAAAALAPVPPAGDLAADLTGPATIAPATPAEDSPAAGAPEPTFAGRPLSELAPLSDAELLKIDGIGRATIKEIRAAAKAK